MVCFYVFIGFWILFVFRSDLYCIEFFIPFEIEVEIVLKSLQRMLNAIVAIELTGVALGAFDVFVDTDFYTETFFESFHQFVERFVLKVVDTVFPQLGFEGADYRLLELAVFELCPVSGFEHRAFFARRYFYRTLDERDHEVFFFKCGSHVEFGSQYFNFSVRRIYDKWFLTVVGDFEIGFAFYFYIALHSQERRGVFYRGTCIEPYFCTVGQEQGIAVTGGYSQ